MRCRSPSSTCTTTTTTATTVISIPTTFLPSAAAVSVPRHSCRRLPSLPRSSSSFFTTIGLLLFLLLLANGATAATTSHHDHDHVDIITTPSGRRIPVPLLRSHLTHILKLSHTPHQPISLTSSRLATLLFEAVPVIDNSNGMRHVNHHTTTDVKRNSYDILLQSSSLTTSTLITDIHPQSRSFSHPTVLDVAKLAPHSHHPSPIPLYASHEDTVPDIVPANLLRHGEKHAFAFDPHSRVLTAAWGPDIHLIPLRIPATGEDLNDEELMSMLYVNIHVNALASTPAASTERNGSGHMLHLIQPDTFTSTITTTSTTDTTSRTTTSSGARHATFTSSDTSTTTTTTPTSTFTNLFTNRSSSDPHIAAGRASFTTRQQQEQQQKEILVPTNGHEFKSEFPIFFDVAFTLDSTLCALYGGNQTLASRDLHTAAVVAHKMAFSRVVSVRITGVVAYCDSRTDPFKTPCLGRSPSARKLTPAQCAHAILRKFSVVWRSRSRLRADVAYLVTGYTSSSSPSSSAKKKKVSKGSVVGAAYVGAACNKQYGFGWMHRAYPIIIAHEMGHSLGAPHDAGPGLMNSALDLQATASMSSRSRRHIQAYVETAAQRSCLSTRTALSPRGHPRFTAFLRIARTSNGEATDVTFAPSVKPGGFGARFFTAHVYRLTTTKHQLFVTAGTLLRRPGVPDFPFVLEYEKKGILVKPSLGVHRAGAGIAARFRPKPIGQNKDDKMKRVIDVFVVFLVQPNSNATSRQLAFKIGLGFHEDESVPGTSARMATTKADGAGSSSSSKKSNRFSRSRFSRSTSSRFSSSSNTSSRNSNSTNSSNQPGFTSTSTISRNVNNNTPQAPRKLPVKMNTFDRWSNDMVVPLSLHAPYIVGLGACFAGSDLLIVYVRQRRIGHTSVLSEPFLVVGRGIQASGVAARGWVGPTRIPAWTTLDDVADISVSTLTSSIGTSAQSPIVVTHTQRVGGSGGWQQRFAVRDAAGKWSMRDADIVYRPDGDTFKLTGGLSFISFDGDANSKKKTMTGVLLQSRRFKSGTTYWIEAGDDLLGLRPPPPKRIATSGMITPFDICRLCYGPSSGGSKAYVELNEMRCKRRFQACFAARSSFAMSEVVAKQAVAPPPSSEQMRGHVEQSTILLRLQQQQRQQQRMQRLRLLSTSSRGIALSAVPTFSFASSSIFCAGFHSLYMATTTTTTTTNNAGKRTTSQKQTQCSATTNPNEMWSRGVREIMASEAQRAAASGERVSVTSQTEFGPATGREFFINLGGLAGHTREATTVSVYIRSNRFLRWATVRRTVRSLRRRPDFANLFKPTQGFIKRMNNKTFLITFNYRQRFQAEFFRTLAARTI